MENNPRCPPQPSEWDLNSRPLGPSKRFQQLNQLTGLFFFWGFLLSSQSSCFVNSKVVAKFHFSKLYSIRIKLKGVLQTVVIRIDKTCSKI